MTSQVRCPPDLLDELTHQVDSDLAGHPELSLELIGDAAGSLRIRLIRADGPAYERRNSFRSSECDELGATVGLILRGWLNREWTEIARTAVAGAAPVMRPSDAAVAVELAAPTEPATGAPWARLMLVGGVATPSGATSPQPVVVGEVSHRWSPLWAVGLSGAFAGTSASPSFGGGRALASQWELALTAHLFALATHGLDFELLAGPAIEIIQARTAGFASVGSKTLIDPALIAGARAHLPLSHRLSLVGSVGASVRSREEQVSVGAIGRILTVATYRGYAGVGVAWALE